MIPIFRDLTSDCLVKRTSLLVKGTRFFDELRVKGTKSRAKRLANAWIDLIFVRLEFFTDGGLHRQ